MKLSFKHSGHAGDIIYSLASVKHICEKKKAKAIYYIKIGEPTNIKGHPTGSVMINQKMFDFLHPLLISQSYIADVLPYQGEDVDYNLDCFRDNAVNLSAGNIATWYANYYPELNPDLSKPWISASSYKKIEQPILARTERYLNPLTAPHLLLLGAKFIGVDREWAIINQLTTKLYRLEVDSALKLARHIASAPFVVSNQTLFFAIAEAMKVPRILEQYFYAPNVIPQGGEWYIYTTQEQLKKILLSLRYEASI
jgi:hypothetical protein